MPVAARISGLILLTIASGCARRSPPADPEFSDAARFLFRNFDGPEADLAFGMRTLERQLVSELDLSSSDVRDRSVTPELLQASDVEGLGIDPSLDVSLALPVTVARQSDQGLDVHELLQLEIDHMPWEPSSSAYERVFIEGGECWEASCRTLRTNNLVTRNNPLMTVDLEFFKDFRRIDLGLPDPSMLDPDEEAVNPGEPRWAMLGRSWTDRSWPGRNGNTTIDQSYTVELWLPNDAGTVRAISLWAVGEIGINLDDDLIIASTRAGMDDGMEAVDAWLADQ